MKFGNQLAIVALAAVTVVPAFAQFRSGGLGGAVQLLSRSDIQQELRVTSEQAAKVKDLNRSTREGMQALVRGLQQVPPQKRRGEFDKFRDGIDRKVVEILDAKQRQRLNELVLQQDGTRALSKADVVAELRLSDDQRKKVGETLRDENQKMRDLYREVSDGKPTLTKEDQGKAAQRMSEIRVRTDEALVSVLTEVQKAQWVRMKGQPFNFYSNKAPGTPPAVTPGTRPKVSPVKPAARPGKK